MVARNLRKSHQAGQTMDGSSAISARPRVGVIYRMLHVELWAALYKTVVTHQVARSASGERTRPECWSRRPAETNFSACDPKNVTQRREVLKVRFGGTPKPAPETGALPKVPKPRAHCFSLQFSNDEQDSAISAISARPCVSVAPNHSQATAKVPQSPQIPRHHTGTSP